MNPRITKEIRVLLPAFGLILAASVMPLFLGPNRHEVPEIWMGLLFGLGCLIMGAEAFGTEFHQKTLPLLLTQPIPRTTLWKEKMRGLGVALVLGTGVLGVAIMLFDRQLISGADFPWIGCGLFPLAIFCTVPYWTLLFRTTLGGGLFAVVTPMLILGVNSYLHQRWMEDVNFLFKSWFVMNGYIHQHWVKVPTAEESSVITLLVLYCATCCWLGYNRFKKLQLVDAYSITASMELGLPARFEAILLRPFRTLSAPFTGHFATLVKKELRLQQGTFLVAAVFCLLAAVGAVLHQRQSAAGQGQDWASQLLGCTFFFYLPVLPLIAGAVSVAEEKAWGVADWHLTMPPSALKQWSIKRLVALGTAVVLGLLLPASLLLGGALIFGTEHNVGMEIYGELSHAPTALAVAMVISIVLGQILLTSVAIYAGSISKTTARALVLALCMLFATGCLVRLGSLIALSHRDLALPILYSLPQYVVRNGTVAYGLLAMEIILLLCLIHRFAYRCFLTREMTVSLLRVQVPLLVAGVLLLTIVFILFSGIPA